MFCKVFHARGRDGSRIVVFTSGQVEFELLDDGDVFLHLYGPALVSVGERPLIPTESPETLWLDAASIMAEMPTL